MSDQMLFPGGGEEITFAEFKALAFRLHHLAEEGSAIDDFVHFLKSGASEREAKRWLAIHIWDFEPALQKALTILLAADALHEAAKQAEADENDPRGRGRRA